MTPTNAALKTKVKNLTSQSQFIFFIPPYGRDLDAGETFTFDHAGGIDSIIMSGRQSPQRMSAEINRLIEDQIIAIIPPVPLVLDTVTGTAKELSAASGVVTGIQPSTEALSDAPTSFANGTPLTTSIPFTWVAPLDTGTRPRTSWIIEYKANASPTWLDFAVADPAVLAASVTGLITGTAYNFRIKAVTAVGRSAASTQVNATTA